MPARDATKVPLVLRETYPLCPWCDAPLAVIHWHKVRGGPPFGYAVILSCPRCHGALEGLAHTDQSAVIV